MTTTPTPELTAAITACLDGDWAGTRQRIRAEVDPHTVLLPAEGSLEDKRAATTAALLQLAEQDLAGMGYAETGGARNDIGGTVVAFETIAALDLSLTVKMGVQFGLFGGAISNLGNPEQHAAWLPSTGSGELLGCFAMTEVGHGSDVQSLETTATYDAATGEFVIDSPTLSLIHI